MDKQLEERIRAVEGEAERGRRESLLGKAAVANAKIAYAKFKELFSSARWQALTNKGAPVQRCLRASTSVKNPRYRDVMYVQEGVKLFADSFDQPMESVSEKGEALLAASGRERS